MMIPDRLYHNGLANSEWIIIYVYVKQEGEINYP